MDAEQLNRLVHTALEDMKAQEVVDLDVRGMTSIADRIIVASGNSSRHVKSIADRVIEVVKDAGAKPVGIEGEKDAEWVLVDLGDIVLHVMLPATRQYYDLERLWSMTPATRTQQPRSDEA
jgi:ribosome-associated protein